MEEAHTDTALEPYQIRNIYQEEDVPFKDISGSIVRKLVYIGGALFLLALIAAFTVRIPREVHLNFTLLGGLEEQVFQYPEKVYIRKTYVSTGDEVSEGDPLVAISSPAILSLIEEIITWESRLSFFREQKNSVREKEQAFLRAKAQGLEKEADYLQKELMIIHRTTKKEILQLKQQLQIEKKLYDRNRKLYEEKVISSLDLERSLQSLQRAEQELLLSESLYERSIATLTSRKQEISNRQNLAEKELENYSSFSKLEEDELIQHLQLARKKLELYYGSSEVENSSIILKSPLKGKVNLISERESEVPPGHILLRLQRDSIRFSAYAEAGPEDIGQLKEGKKVVLKLKSFPHYYYGTLKAELSHLSPSPAANGNYPMNFRISEASPLFLQLTKGMTGTASVIIEEKSFIAYLLRDLSTKSAEILDK